MSIINYHSRVENNLFKSKTLKLACLIWATMVCILMTSYIILNHYIEPIPYNITQIPAPSLETDNPIHMNSLPNGVHTSIQVLSDET